MFIIICTNNGETICEGFGAKFVRDTAAGSCGNKKTVTLLRRLERVFLVAIVFVKR